MNESPQCLAVMYHYVRDADANADGGDGIVALNPVDFAAQLDRLCADLEPVDWQLLDDWYHGRANLPERSFLLTFDDGLIDHADVVAPILERRGLRGVFLVSTESIVERRPAPAHQLHALLSALGADPLHEMVLARLADVSNDRWHLTQADRSRVDSIYHYESPVRAEIKYLIHYKLSSDLRDDVLGLLCAAHLGPATLLASRWYLTIDQLRDLQSAGHTIGGHGHRHEPYARLTPIQQQHDAIRSIGLLTEHLGAGSRPFSYPFGSIGDSAVHACQEAGFTAAFTTVPAWIDAQSDRFRMGRVDTIAVDNFLETHELCPR